MLVCCAIPTFFICTLTARSTMLAISVITVEISTAEPNTVLVIFRSRMIGNTIPTECEANSEAYSSFPGKSSALKKA